MIDINTRILIIYSIIIIIIMISVCFYEKNKQPNQYLTVVDNSLVVHKKPSKCYYNIVYSQLTKSSSFTPTGTGTPVSAIPLTKPNIPGTLNTLHPDPKNSASPINIVGLYNNNGLNDSTSPVTVLPIVGIVAFYARECPSNCYKNEQGMNLTNIKSYVSNDVTDTSPSSQTEYLGGFYALDSAAAIKYTNMMSTQVLQRMVIGILNDSQCSLIVYFYDTSNNFRQITIQNIPQYAYLELNFRT
jgi:hypothetical protein